MELNLFKLWSFSPAVVMFILWSMQTPSLASIRAEKGVANATCVKRICVFDGSVRIVDICSQGAAEESTVERMGMSGWTH